MPHINLPQEVPGIRSLVMYRPETGKYLYELVQLLLRGESPLSAADRELIATYVSYLNNCEFCYQSHAAAARCLYGEKEQLVDSVLKDLDAAPVSPKLKALLVIAGKVQKLGKEVKPEDIEHARAAGAGDRDIHFEWAEKKGADGLHEYVLEKNLKSLDGLPTDLGLNIQ